MHLLQIERTRHEFGGANVSQNTVQHTFTVCTLETNAEMNIGLTNLLINDNIKKYTYI